MNATRSVSRDGSFDGSQRALRAAPIRISAVLVAISGLAGRQLVWTPLPPDKKLRPPPTGRPAAEVWRLIPPLCVRDRANEEYSDGHRTKTLGRSGDRDYGRVERDRLGDGAGGGEGGRESRPGRTQW